ncbi:proteasome assembly chaperone family protein [Pseudonocardia sp. WMMC193]|uniref:proteasome assembly chaperone family protein n=1 Tax=Pseudonocardia sp. WMMC193 TaxID=2911965 RepID=UPI001F15A91F|nr:PAC2 family protein [Pseudonocardia sp. WMMC193]MCF7548065.1 PAC2 family protein [Pseudonocardia sp. WMMC193]
MLDPAELYRVEEGVSADPDGSVLLVVLDGFVDAGNAGRLAVEALREGRDARTLVSFDTDQLVDYRSRRPPLTFDTDHWAAYEPPVLDVVALTDSAESQFLLLAGPEPDTQWERFIAAVGQLVERLNVRLVVTLQGIPMAVPHTRPIGVTAHATRKELIEGHEPWFAEAQVPGSASGLLEYRLGEAGKDVVGFAVHVPHYLARAEYPHAARTLLDHTAVATGLYLPTEGLTTAAERTDAEIAEQVAGSAEVAEVVRALEKQYDSVAAGRAAGGLGSGDLPSADELAAEVERFLADQEDDKNGGPGFGEER